MPFGPHISSVWHSQCETGKDETEMLLCGFSGLYWEKERGRNNWTQIGNMLIFYLLKSSNRIFYKAGSKSPFLTMWLRIQTVLHSLLCSGRRSVSEQVTQWRTVCRVHVCTWSCSEVCFQHHMQHKQQTRVMMFVLSSKEETSIWWRPWVQDFRLSSPLKSFWTKD